MARPEVVPLDVKKSVATGTAAEVFRFRDKYVQLYGTFVATLQVEGSISGGEYFPIGAPQSAPGVIPVIETVQFLRLRTTAFTSGEPAGVMGGFDERAF